MPPADETRDRSNASEEPEQPCEDSDDESLDTQFIVQHAQQDDRDAWVLLSAKVVFFMRSRFGNVALPAELEFDDFASEVMVKLLTEVRNYHGQGKDSFWGWIYRIAQNRLNDLWRAHNRDERIRSLALGDGTGASGEADVTSLDEYSDPKQVPVSDSCHVRELEAIERECVDRLPSGLAKIYVLRRQQQLAFQEISPLVGGIKAVTLRSYFKRARDAVKRCIRGKLDRFGQTFEDWQG